MKSRKHLFTPRNAASLGDATDVSSTELLVLGDHLGLCRSPHGRLFALHCAAESMHGFIVSRLVTTFVIASLLIVLTALVL